MLDKNIPFFFIIGRPRSGTTLVQSLLDVHPNINIPGESPIILRLFMKYKDLKQLDDNTIKLLVDEVKNQPKIENWPMDFDRLKADLEKIKGPFDYQAFIKVVYLNFQSAFNKDEILSIGDKNPNYSKFPRFLLRIFPDARFIYIIRDYRDNFLSVKKSGLLYGILPWIMLRWIDSVNVMNKVIKEFPDRVYTVRYEDFIQEPDKRLSEMSEFLGVPEYKELLHDYQENKQAAAAYKEKKSEVFHKKIYQPVDATNFDKWKKQLSEEEIMLLDRIAGTSGEQFGYKKQFTNFAFSTKLYVWKRMLVIRLFLLSKTINKLFPMKHRVWVNNKFPTIDKVYFFFFKK